MHHAAPLDVVTLGEALVLWAAELTGPLTQVQSFSQHTAGAETNVAVGLSRLGLRVGWVSRLGDDANGRYLRQAFEHAGIDCSRVATVLGGHTATMQKGRVDDGSDPPIAYQRTNSAASQLGPEHLDVPWLTSARHLHVTGIFPALSPSTMVATQAAMRHMRAHHKTISFDPNLRPALWPDRAVMRASLNALAAQADWVLPGLDEGRQLTGCDTPQDIARFYRETGATQVVVKLGAQGAYVDGPGGCAFVPAFPVAHVVDTVGAGDAFAVGVISALLEGATLAEAARRGAWLGARVVQVRGDCEGLPTRAELSAAGL
jgi:2-dehydro-3-deoxygluconokinase